MMQPTLTPKANTGHLLFQVALYLTGGGMDEMKIKN